LNNKAILSHGRDAIQRFNQHRQSHNSTSLMIQLSILPQYFGENDDVLSTNNLQNVIETTQRLSKIFSCFIGPANAEIFTSYSDFFGFKNRS